jgi:hypothetical protein
MKTKTVTKRIGEKVSKIDYEYDFLSHYKNHTMSSEKKKELCKKTIDKLKAIEKALSNGEKVLVHFNHSIFYKTALDVGMYDGWPYWRPVPSIKYSNERDGYWHDFSYIVDYKIVKEEQE